MNVTFFARGLGLLAFAALAAACSGSGGGALPPAGAGPSGPGTSSNALTTYTAYVGTIGAQGVVDVEPFGTAAGANIAGAHPTNLAYVVYPDNSVQAVDALGNFDVSKSVWALGNTNILVANLNNYPTVQVFATTSNNPTPEEVAVNAYAPGAGIVLAGDMLRTESTTSANTPAELAHVVVYPQSASMLGNRTKLFHAIGKDSNGSIALLNKAPIAWSLTRSAGCGIATGKLKAIANDPSTVIFIPPTSGSSTANCPDQVIATVAAGSVALAGSANAFFYDATAAVQVAGVLKTAAGAPAAGAIINLYGGSPEANKGSLLVRTDANGKFSRIVPSSRILAPVAALTPDKAKSPFTVIAPSSINPATAGAALANQNWTMTAASVIAPKPQPPFAELVRDATYYGNVARESLPFGAPNAAGQFNAGSIEYILAHPAANQTGTLTTGFYAGYAFAWDAAAKVATFTQPGASNAKVLTVTINASAVNGQPCPSGAACFSYVRKAGAVLESDGTWAQKLNASKFAVTYVRNAYNGTHQTAGSPIESHLLSTEQIVGTQTLTISDQRFNAVKQSLGTLNVSRTAGSGSVLYTYAGTVHALSYKADGSTIAVDFSIGKGVENTDYSGSYAFSITGSPSTNDIGDAVTFAINSPSATLRAMGTVDGVGFTGLTSGHVASFVISKTGTVTLTKDASLGANTITFQL